MVGCEVGGPLWVVLGRSRSLYERSWVALAALGAPVGGLGPVMGPVLAVLGRSWGLSGRFWALLGPLGALLGANMAPRWPQKGPKRVPKSTKNRPQNRSKNRSKIESDPGRPKWPKHYACSGFRGVGTLTQLRSGQPPKLSIRLNI